MERHITMLYLRTLSLRHRYYRSSKAFGGFFIDRFLKICPPTNSYRPRHHLAPSNDGPDHQRAIIPSRPFLLC